MADFYFQLPIWASTSLVLGVCIAVGVGGHLLVRRIVGKNTKQETELAVALMGVIAAFIGIMLAFSAVQVWEDYGNADKAVAAEAASAAQLYRDLSIYGDESLVARRSLTAYVHTVVDDEWPAMARSGEASPKTAAALVQVFNDIAAIEPTSGRQTVIYGEAFKKLNEVVEHRRARLLAAHSELPALFWLVALVGSSIILGYTFIFPATRTNLMLIAGLAASLGLIFVFILDVEHPFSGRVSVGSEELRGLIPMFESLNRVRGA
jgi:hypothetical protein